MQEISDLRMCSDSKEAINRLMHKISGKLFSHYDYDPVSGSYYGKAIYKDDGIRWKELPAFLLFSEIVETHYESEEEERKYYGGRGGKFPTKYGESLAALIKENNLGEVVESPVRRNRVNHPKHDVRVYIWTPDIDGLQAYASAQGFPSTLPDLINDFDYENDDDEDNNYDEDED